MNPVLKKKYRELEKNIEMHDFHQILLMKLSSSKKIRRNCYAQMNFWKKKYIYCERFPYSSANVKFRKSFVSEIVDYTNGKVELVIIWNSSKIQSLFNYKGKVQHQGCIIYCSVCSRGAYYTGETIRNSKLRWKEHSTGRDKNFDCVRHLNNNNFNHEFWWFVSPHASKNRLKGKILEAFNIKTRQLLFNTQVNNVVFHLFRNGVT